jgi:hypothetical protein
VRTAARRSRSAPARAPGGTTLCIECKEQSEREEQAEQAGRAGGFGDLGDGGDVENQGSG